MVINHEILDLVLIVSLGLLALCSIIFLIFFIPVLIQLSKTLAALHSLIAVFENYSKGFQNSLNSAKNGAIKVASYIGEVFNSFTEGITDIFFQKENREIALVKSYNWQHV